VLSLQPDLLIGEADTGPTKVVNQIKATGIKKVIIEVDDTIPAIKNNIRLIAQLGVLGTFRPNVTNPL
jgi:iron complex transport system substrate-binding protein